MDVPFSKSADYFGNFLEFFWNSFEILLEFFWKLSQVVYFRYPEGEGVQVVVGKDKLDLMTGGGGGGDKNQSLEARGLRPLTLKNWRPILPCSYFWTFAQCV